MQVRHLRPARACSRAAVRRASQPFATLSVGGECLLAAATLLVVGECLTATLSVTSLALVATLSVVLASGVPWLTGAGLSAMHGRVILAAFVTLTAPALFFALARLRSSVARLFASSHSSQVFGSGRGSGRIPGGRRALNSASLALARSRSWGLSLRSGSASCSSL